MREHAHAGGLPPPWGLDYVVGAVGTGVVEGGRAGPAVSMWGVAAFGAWAWVV